MSVRAERVYDAAKRSKGGREHRVLVDGVWPRGVRKADLDLDEWLRAIAPSKELRQWFGHDPERWEEFRRRYQAELRDRGDEVEALRRLAAEKDLVLLFGAREERYNHARVLEEKLRG